MSLTYQPYPPQPQSWAPPPAPAPGRNNVGLAALIVAAIGFVFACVPGALIVGWALLPVGFILGIVGLLLPRQKRATSIAAVVVSIIGTIVGFTVFFTVVGDAVDDAFEGGDMTPATDASANAAAGGSDSSDKRGTRDNPLPIGETVSSPDWTVDLGDPYLANAEVAAENQFNDPPPAGMEYWIVPVVATYTGDKTGNPLFEVSVKFVGADNRTYSDNCGVIPSSLQDIGELYAGGEASGNACVVVPAGADGLWTVTTGFAGSPVFFTAR
jgi:hypothetical protein